MGTAPGTADAACQALGTTHQARPAVGLDQRVRHRQRAAPAGRSARPERGGNRARRTGDRGVRRPLRRAARTGDGRRRGIGRATAFAFAEAGARVVAVDRDAEGPPGRRSRRG
ncbi:hypothetical protein NKH18_26260 [Streptomyces sp. M10(2022)]